MLGALHKVTIGTAHAQLRLLFPLLAAPPTVPNNWQQRLRNLRALHDRQLSTAATPFSTDTFGRSLFGLVNLYNRLPQHLVECTSVKLFQRKLQFGLRRQADTETADWQQLYSTGWKRLSLPQLDAVFL